MREVFFGNKGFSLLIPLLRSTKLNTFKVISADDKNKIQSILKDVFSEKKLSSRRKILQNWTDYLYISTDPASYFLASQINLVLSSPELVRNELMLNNGCIKEEIKEIEDKSLKKLQKYYIINDLPAVFSIIVKLYFDYLCKLEDDIQMFIEREEFIDSIKQSGEMMKNENFNLFKIYNLFERYCNKPLAGFPIETFVINYVFQLFYENLYEQREYLTISDFKNFCNVFGKNLISLSKTLETRNYNKSYNLLFNMANI